MVENNEFTIPDTLFAKGLAISLVLFQHSFYLNPEYGMVTYQAALISKVGVALFVFLSGFGLYRSFKSKGDTGIVKYFFVRFKRLYIPYWSAWILFVPVGVLYFKISLASVYGPDVFFFGFLGYNPTWWFVSLILALYALSPAVFYLVDRLKLGFVAISALALAVPDTFFLWFITIYFFPFVLGVYVSRERMIEKYAALMSSRIYLKLIMYISILLVLIWQRQSGIFKAIIPDAPTSIDGIISLLIAMLSYEYLGRIRHQRQFFIFLGKHAYNLFLIHTFFLLYFMDFIYSFDYVPVVFCVLLGLSLAASSLMNVLMKKAGLDI
jgi:peptidoglycan/LPS O-acetylase OafA/YrhL